MAWQIKTLGEVCEITNGGTPKTTVPEYWNGKHLWITPAEMGKRSSPFVNETERKLSDSGLKNSSAQLLPPHSVILSSRAPIGHLVINTSPMATNQGCKGLVPRNGLDAKFLYYYLGSIVDQLNAMGTGATFKEISGGKLKEVSIPVPSFGEQKQTAKVLDEVFEKTAKAKENAEKNLQNARDIFESYLQGVFSNPGDGWEEKTLGDSSILEIIDGDRGIKYPKKSDFLEKGHCLFLNTKNVRPDGFCFDTTMFITKEKDAALRKGKLIRNDVILTTRGTIGNLAVFNSDVPYENIRINSGMLIFRPNTKKLLPAFLFEVLRSGIIKAQIARHVSGAAQPQLPIKTLVNFKIPVPRTVDAQAKIVASLKEIAANTKRLEAIYQQKLADLEELKKSVLHKAFNGELAGACS